MSTLDRVLAFMCAVTAVFALAFAAGRVVGPVGPNDDPPAPTEQHHPGGDGEH